MEILFASWFPPMLVVAGVVLLILPKSVGPKIFGGILLVFGIPLLALEIWVFYRHLGHHNFPK